MSKVTRLAFIILICTCPFGFAGIKNSLDGPPARVKFYNSVQKLFNKEKYALLEKMGGKLLEEESRFPEGLWKLGRFYDALLNVVPENNPSNIAFDKKIEMLDQWQSIVPNSQIAPILKAGVWRQRAWFFRGNGYANTVTQDEWEQFHQCLQEAKRVLLEIKQNSPSDKLIPFWYTTMQDVALGQGWKRRQYEELVSQAVLEYPKYYDFYFNAALFWAPRWYGEKTTWRAYADKYAKNSGIEIYTRMAWSNLLVADRKNFFQSTGADWDKMKKGFESMIKEWPESTWNKAAYCSFACLARDRKTAQRLFTELGDLYHPGAWDSKKQYLKMKKWAQSLE